MQNVIADVVSFKSGVLEVYLRDTKSFIVLLMDNYKYIQDKLVKGAVVKISYTKKQRVNRILFIGGNANG